ncbi:MAG TPA: response regulator transcription factor [Solirubrobacteraceae bacterium]|nr:response regulator transcription factor [Solirubrobacteraceae bacterium]
MPAAIRVLVVDDHPAVRTGLLAMLADEPGIEPAGAAASASAAHEAWLASDERPDVVFVDYHLPDEDGLSLCLWLKTADPAPAVVIYSAFADEGLALPAVVAGADALVGKSTDPAELSDVVRAVAAGRRCLPPVSPRVDGDLGARLAPEDLPILGMLRHGVPAAEIAATLGLDAAELATRRWAMLELLTAVPERIERRGAAPAVQAMRTASSPSAITSPG